MHELNLRRIQGIKQQQVQIQYKDAVFEENLQFDILVANCLLIEVKAVQEIAPIDKARVISHLKLLNVPLGLLINFHEMRLVDGVSRFILPHSNR